jgi:putative transposase
MASGCSMRLVEQHRIDRHDSRFAALDLAAFAAKNLYNAAT